MQLPEDLKHLFLTWIQAEYSIKLQMQSKMAHTYGNAMKSLKTCPMTIKHPAQLMDVKFFGDKLVKMMQLRLEEYCEEYSLPYPNLPEEMKEKERIQKEKEERLKNKNKNRKAKEVEKQGKEAAKRSLDSSDDTAASKKKKTTKKRYVPQVNSGGYAILLVLFLHDKHGTGMTKSEITKFGVNYCTSSFQNNASTGRFYNAFSSMKTLIKNEYVVAEGRPEYYSLTEEGREVAKVLNEMENANPSSIAVNTSSVNSTPRSNRKMNEKENARLSSSIIKEKEKDKNPLASSSPNVNRSIAFSSSPLRGGSLDVLKHKKDNNNLMVSSPLRSETHLHNNTSHKSEYQVWKPGTYKIKFLLDNREIFSKQDRAVFGETLKARGIDVEVRSLPVGDGLWIAVNKKSGQETTLNYIFERKRLDDLVGSIKDGRYREQKSRLEKTGMKNIYYIVEEQINTGEMSQSMESIKTAMSMATTYSGFRVKRTRNSDSTLKLIESLHKIIINIHKKTTLLVLEPRNYDDMMNVQGGYAKILNAMQTTHSDKEVVYSYNTFASRLGKSSELRVKSQFAKILMCIRGIGMDKAAVISGKYKTPRELFEEYEKAHLKGNCRTLIKAATIQETGARKVGEALSSKIALVFCTQCGKEKSKDKDKDSL